MHHGIDNIQIFPFKIISGITISNMINSNVHNQNKVKTFGHYVLLSNHVCTLLP